MYKSGKESNILKNKLTKEKLLEIIEGSADGTLAFNEAKFVLNTFYSSDEDNSMVLSEEELEQTAGGKLSIRTLALALLLGILAGGGEFHFQVSAISAPSKLDV